MQNRCARILPRRINAYPLVRKAAEAPLSAALAAGNEERGIGMNEGHGCVKLTLQDCHGLRTVKTSSELGGYAKLQRVSLSTIIHTSRSGMCATVACISHFARVFVRDRFAHSPTCSKIL